MKSSILLFLCLLLSACGAGSGEGLDVSGRPIEESPPPPEPTDDNSIKSTLTSIQAKVFSPICSVCHGGASPAAGQDLSSIEKSIAALINVDSSNPQFKRVLPGDPENSYLYLKVTGNSQAGAQMPLGGPALDNDSIAAIKKWIADGAVVPGNIPVQTMVSRVVVNHDRLITFDNEQSRQLSLSFWFNKSMDFSGLSAEQIKVSAVSQNTNVTLNPSQFVLTPTTGNVLTLTIVDIDPQIARLSIGLNNTSLSSVISANGQLLDGDSNGFAGGEYSYDHQF